MSNNIIIAGKLTIYEDTREVFNDGELLYLTESEYNLLCTLARNKNRLCLRENIMNELYGERLKRPGNAVVTVIVCRLRKKFDENDVGLIIEGVWAYGYAIREVVE